MKLNDSLLVKLSKRYEPSSMLNMKFRGIDVAVKTDRDGNPVVVFVGKKQADGKIKGERYTRTMLRDGDGNLIKDHWDRKGKT
jgi:hypothetical protein